MSILFLFRDMPICLLHFILLLLMFIIILLLILVMPITKGTDFQEKLFYKIERIFIQFYYTILILVLIILFLFLPVYTIFYVLQTNIYPITFMQFIITVLFFIVVFIIALGVLKKPIIKKRMRKIFDTIIPNLNLNIAQKSQDRLINFMNNLRALVIWISIIAFILSFWGFGDLFIIIYYPGLSDLDAPFFILTAILKILISFLLFIGCYALMVRPLYKIQFWKNIIEG